MGNGQRDLLSPLDKISCEKGACRSFEMILNPVQLGPGDYTVSLSAHQYSKIEVFNAAPRYDLLSLSFELSVVLPDSLGAIATSFYHSAEWTFETKAAS